MNEAKANPLAKVPAVKMPGLTFQVCEVSPAVAANWLKRNENNRRLKRNTVELYARDMRNTAWRVTHQGVGQFRKTDKFGRL